MDEDKKILQEENTEAEEETKTFDKEEIGPEASAEAVEETAAVCDSEEEAESEVKAEAEAEAETETETETEDESESETENVAEDETEPETETATEDESDEPTTSVESSTINEALEDEQERRELKAEAARYEKEQEKEELSPEDIAIVEKIKQRKIESAAREKRRKRRLISSLITAFVLITAFALSFTSIFTVDSIEVKGNSHYTAEEIISMGHAVAGKNLIYHSDKNSIKGFLEQNPYIKNADVKRKLPSTLVIEVEERTEMMALPYDDDFLILDTEGILLKKNRTQPKLTLAVGNVINRIKLGEELGTKDADLMKKTTKLVQAMTANDLYYVKVDMSDTSNVKAYIYNSLIVRTDYDTLIENMENGRLHKVLDELFSDSIKRGTITFSDDGTATFMPTL